jgi:Multimeric flavodoxin WrbA
MQEEHKASSAKGGKNFSLSRRKFFAFTGAATFMGMLGNLLPGWFSFGSSAPSEAFAATRGSGKLKNILIITGSARERGNSDLLAEAFAGGAREAGHTVNVFHSGRDRMDGCLACDACWSTGKPCVIEDNFDKLWPLLEQADMLVFCSPLYWYTYSGHIKNAIDRLYAYSKKNTPRDLKIKEAMLLMCGESWFKKSFDGPAESYRQMLGFKGWKDRGRLFVTSVHEKGEIAGNSSLKTAEKMGREA